MSDQTCPEIVPDSAGWGSHICGRPVKRDGLCGLHAAAKDRRERGDRERQEKREAHRAATKEREQVAAALARATGLPVRAGYTGGTYVIDHAAALAWLRKVDDR